MISNAKRHQKPEEETLRENHSRLLQTSGYLLMLAAPGTIWFLWYESIQTDVRVDLWNSIFTACFISALMGLASIWLLNENRNKEIDASIKRVRTALWNEHFSAEEIPASLKHGFEYCNDNVDVFRVYAVSSRHLIAALETINNIHIKNCHLMVRGYGDNMSFNESDANDEIEKNIERWENLKCIDNFDYIQYNNYPLTYFCIFDDKFVSFGQYVFEEEEKDKHKTKFLSPFSITNQTKVGQQMIKNLIEQFDSYFNSEKKQSINFNKLANRYDNLRKAEDELINILINNSKIEKNAKILDFGCGTGNYIEACKKLGFKNIFGLDISRKMREIATKKTKIQILRNINEIPDNFDFIFMIDVVHLIKDISTYSKSLYTKCNNTAQIAIVTQSHEQIQKRYYKKFFPTAIQMDLQRYHDIDLLISSFEEAGFHLQKKETYQENTTRILDVVFLNRIKNKCFSMFELISNDEFNRGIQEFEKEISKAPCNVIHENYAGKTIICFSKSKKGEMSHTFN